MRNKRENEMGMPVFVEDIGIWNFEDKIFLRREEM